MSAPFEGPITKSPVPPIGGTSSPEDPISPFSLRLGRVFGIPINIHWTFWILILWIGLSGLIAGEPTNEVLVDIIFIMAIFACVVLHELGHALAALRYGIKTSDITLLPIGGVARLKSIPEKPIEELIVAIAGPAVNVVIALVLYAIGARVFVNIHAEQWLLRGGFLDRLLIVNLMLVGFNLLPAFPMDGGRVLRALLAMVMDYGRATAIAARVGQLMAILFVYLGLQYNPFLILIALFVWVGASSEAAMVGQRLALRGVSVRDAMMTEFATLTPTQTLGQAAELLLAGSQEDFPVEAEGRFTGVLTRAALLTGLAKGGRDALVSEFQVPDVPIVEADLALIEAIPLIRERAAACLRVVQAGRTIGLLNQANISEYVMIRSALGTLSDRSRTAAESLPA